MSEQINKLVQDEQTLARLLEAAFVLQEHGRALQGVGEPNLAQYSEQLRKSEGVGQAQASARVTRDSSTQDDYSLILARIVETQSDIQSHQLGLQDALALMTERVAEICKAQGAAIGVVEGDDVRYFAGAGSPALPAGSRVAAEKAVCLPCLRTGQLLRCPDVDPEFLVDAAECHRRGIQSLIVVPVYQDAGIAGALELYFARTYAFSEQDVHACQLMAGVVTEALARDSQRTSNQLAPMQQPAIPEPREYRKVGLTALTASATVIPPVFACRKCGHTLLGQEQFCGNCGSRRTNDVERPNLQSTISSLWETEPRTATMGANGAGSILEASDILGGERASAKKILNDRAEAGGINEYESPEQGEVREVLTAKPAQDSEKKPEVDALQIQPSTIALTTTSSDITWSSAANARAFLEQLTASQSQGALARFWKDRRGTVYLAVAVILMLGVVRWELWSDRSVSAGRSVGVSGHRKLDPNADLSLFDKLLVGIGLAEPPDAPEYKGNPETEVWVDLHTALYYCPGTDLYGKTPLGKFTTQRDAQLDQFEPAYRKACN